MYRAEIVSRGDQRYLASTRHGSFTMATDGSDSNPVDTLLSSLCGCLGHYVGDYLERERIAFSGFSVKAESELAEDRTRLAGIDVLIGVDGATLTDVERAGLSEFVTRCHVHNTLKANGPIRIAVRPGDGAD